MKILIPGGTGQVGTILARAIHAAGHEVIVLGRSPISAPWRLLRWDARTPGPWGREFEGADVVINLAGRSVNCRYTSENRKEILESRTRSARLIGRTLSELKRPPRIWLQMSTATIYSHRFDAPNDEHTGIIAKDHSSAPDTWGFSVDVARAWESAVDEFELPATRKVKLRSAMVMSPDRGGVFDTLLGLVRRGLGGASAGGRQYVSWIHEYDFVRAIEWVIECDDLHGPVNFASPNPVTNAEFMRALRDAWGTRLGLPASELMLKFGAFLMRSESELILKSRRVVPTKLLESGFVFNFGQWGGAARELCERWRNLQRRVA